MEFISWHYSQGLKLYLRRWMFALGWVVHYFSLTLLPFSLFAPWKRLSETDDVVGFNLEKIFEQITFNLISRTIGAFVRLFLLFCGVVFLVPTFAIGLIGLIFWLCVPLVGLPDYYVRETRGQHFLLHLLEKMNSEPQDTLKHLFDNSAGKFVATHIGLSVEELIALATSTPDLKGFSATSYTQILEKFIDSGTWPEDALRQKGVDYPDLVLAAQWWDERHSQTDLGDFPLRYSRPGIGLELLFGYTRDLDQYVTDLSTPQNFSHHLIGREELVTRIERTLIGGQSVILEGEPGVGKKTVVLEFARRSSLGELDPQLIYQRVLEFDYHFLLSESGDLNQKKARLAQLFSEASSAGNIILVVKDIQRLTNRSVEGLDFTDIFEKALEKKELKILAISTQGDYERFVYPNTRLRKFFVPIEVASVSREHAFQIMSQTADVLEKQHHLTFTVQILEALLVASEQYITEAPFPQKVLDLMDDLAAFVGKVGHTIPTLDDVNRIVSERTGVSIKSLTDKEKKTLANLEDILHEGLVNQNTAVSLISKSLRARSVGVKNDSRPIGSFLFLGPTGVGKTQTAKSLGKIYYGSEKNIVRFDMAEFSGDEGMSRLIGSVRQDRPGMLTTAIKNHPASILLLDEIEKASPEIFNLFLTLLDEGYIVDAFNRQIMCRHLFVIATSNAGAEFIRQQVGLGIPTDQLQKNVLDYIQKEHLFSPEFLNRFDGVVVFEPLTPDNLVKVARLMLGDLKIQLEKQDIHLNITDALCQKIAQDGFQPEFGARPMRRILDITLGDILGKAILSGQINPGDTVEIIPGQGREELSLSRVAKM